MTQHDKDQSSENSEACGALPAILQPGQVVGEKYRIVCALGSGGMGAVYKVHHLFLNKDFALKTVNRGNLSDTAIQRFHLEARAAGALNHPNVVAVNDFGLLEDRRPFLVMELVPGVPLSRFLHVEESSTPTKHWAPYVVPALILLLSTSSIAICFLVSAQHKTAPVTRSSFAPQGPIERKHTSTPEVIVVIPTSKGKRVKVSKNIGRVLAINEEPNLLNGTEYLLKKDDTIALFVNRGFPTTSLIAKTDPLLVGDLRLGANNELEDRDLKGIGKWSNLFKLDVQRTELSDACIDELSKIKSLRELIVSNTRITGKGLACLQQLNQLHVLEYENPSDVSPLLSALKNHKRLKFLNLNRAELKESDFELISTCSNLRTLSLKDCKGIKPSDLRSLSKLKHLQMLDVQDCDLSRECLPVFKTFPDLQALAITGWSEADIKSLARTGIKIRDPDLHDTEQIF